MQYSLVNGSRNEAFPGGKGTCPACGAATLAKCGSRVIHHWAHARLQDCDPWWENETPWHRDWKKLFPPEWREVPHLAPDGEIHRADVKTTHGIVVELQHSSITDAERISRERFYGNLVWVLDGRDFRKNFDIYHKLPDPNSELAKDLVWSKGTREKKGAAGGFFLRISENPGSSKTQACYGTRRMLFEIEDEINAVYRGHHQFDWVRPRQAWLESTCPVYIDFGEPNLVRIEKYDVYQLPCIRFVPKDQFVRDALTVARTADLVP